MIDLLILMKDDTTEKEMKEIAVYACRKACVLGVFRQVIDDDGLPGSVTHPAPVSIQ